MRALMVSAALTAVLAVACSPDDPDPGEEPGYLRA